MNRTLFKSAPQELTFEKNASIAALPEDPSTWSLEIHQELYKQVPYIDAYEADVELLKVDGERGYAFGHVLVTTKVPAEIQPEAGTMPPMNQTNVTGQSGSMQRTVRLPIVVRDRKLLPIDLIVGDGGRMWPLNEERLRQCMFRPALFDMYKTAPGDQSMVNQLFPPMGRNMGGMGMGGMSGSMGKFGSASEQLFSFIMDEPMEKTALGAMLASAVKKQMDPARLSNISRLATSRGAQLAAAGGDAAKKGQKYLTLGNYAAQKVANMTAAMPMPGGEQGMAQLAKSKNDAATQPPAMKVAEESDLVQQVKSLLEAKKSAGGSKSPMLKGVNGNVQTEQIAKMADALKDPSVKHAFLSNPGTKHAASALAFLETSDDVHQDMAMDVFQASKVASGQYMVRIASSTNWKPTSYDLNRQELVEQLGEKVAAEVDTSGSVTLTEAEEDESPSEEGYAAIVDSGVYKVQDLKGNELIGICFANLIDLDGKKVPVQLFTNGSVKSLQGDIAGVKVSGDGPVIRRGSRARGEGIFFSRNIATGELLGMVPMSIKGTLDKGGRDASISGVDYMGRPFKLKRVDAIHKVVLGADGTLLVPTSWDWLPLEDMPAQELVATVDSVKKAGYENQLTIMGSPEMNFHFFGGAVQDIADQGEKVANLSQDEAVFLLCGLGMSPGGAAIKLAHASMYEGVSFSASRSLSFVEGRTQEESIEKVAEDESLEMSEEDEVLKIAYDTSLNYVLEVSKDLLVKEAAVLPDPLAVDAVLSLGFINEDNIGVFVRLRPLLEEAESRLAELLLATRLGLRNIPEGALERALPNVEKVLSGLRVLSLSANASVLSASSTRDAARPASAPN